MHRDPLDVLEAVYAFEREDGPWLAGLLDALEPYDLGGGNAAYISLLDGPARVSTLENRSRLLPDETLRRMAAELPLSMYRALHAPTPTAAGGVRFSEILSAHGITYDPRAREALGIPVPPKAWAFAGGDLNATALVVFHSVGRDLSRSDRTVLDAVSAHLGAAMRLRRLAYTQRADDDVVEGVFTPDGRMLDARGQARETAVRAPLLDAVRRSERARLRGATEEERLEVWTSLVEGRWSILESVERDGKRLLLACRNDPKTAPLRALTERERAVVSCAAYGHAYKFIAYELGIPLSTVAATLGRALRKLGVASRTELVTLFARAGAPFTVDPAAE